jgi:hypothetical protein
VHQRQLLKVIRLRNTNMSLTYLWAANTSKLQRAIAKVKGGSESEIKAEYIRIGGLVIEDKIVVEDSLPVAPEDFIPGNVISTTDPQVAPEEYPVSTPKKGKKKNK